MVYKKKNLARIAGFFYLLVIALGLFAEVFVRQALRIPGDAIGTAALIRSSEGLYRAGIIADVLNFLFGLPVVLIMYFLFKPVNKYMIGMAVFFVIIQTAIIATNLLNQISPLLFLGNDIYLEAFTPYQLALFTKQSIDLQVQGYGIGLIFFGFYCLSIGYLILKSTLVPRILGVLYALAGLSYLINSFTMLSSRGFANPLFPYFAVVSFIGEFSLCLWLLIKGVREDNSQ